jgi:hypothetical protein
LLESTSSVSKKGNNVDPNEYAPELASDGYRLVWTNDDGSLEYQYRNHDERIRVVEHLRAIADDARRRQAAIQEELRSLNEKRSNAERGELPWKPAPVFEHAEGLASERHKATDSFSYLLVKYRIEPLEQEVNRLDSLASALEDEMAKIA